MVKLRSTSRIRNVIWGLSAVAFILILVAGYLAFDLLWSSIHPRYRHVPTSEIAWPANPTFQSCWQDTNLRFHGALTWVGNGNRWSFCDSQGTYLPVNNDPVMVMTVAFPKANPPPPGAPAMQMGITSMCGLSAKYFGETAIVPNVRGNPPIVCDLNATQAAYVWQNGIPQSLIDAMQAAAQNAGWQPLDRSGAGAVPGPPVNVDPKPHFP